MHEFMFDSTTVYPLQEAAGYKHHGQGYTVKHVYKHLEYSLRALDKREYFGNKLGLLLLTLH